MVTRRSFLKTSAAALPLLTIQSNNLWAASHIPIGLQLYTVRGLPASDLPDTLKQIRAIGYQEVEAYGDSYTPPADQLRAMVRDAGLSIPSGHIDYNKIPEKIDYAKQLGLKWIVCPMIPRNLWTQDGFRTAAQQFNEYGRLAKNSGMRFAFHNHDYEFADYGGKIGYDILVSDTDPDLVFFELDCYWAAQAGHDPLTMLQTLGKRIRLLHLKDRKAGFPTSFAMNAASAHFEPVGEGAIQWKPILDAAERLRVEHYFVEQDDTYGHPMESIRASYQYLRTVIA